MREDLIHDALNLLDDELIEEVDYLRSRKKRSDKKWISWATMAACMCIVMGSVYFGLLGTTKKSDNESSMESIVESEGMNGEDPDNSAIAESENQKDKVDSEATREVPAFLVEIVEWKEDGFIGTITGIVDTDIYPVGTSVFVSLESIPTMADVNEPYSEGSVVHVQFNRLDEAERILLYAEDIWLVQEK